MEVVFSHELHAVSSSTQEQPGAHHNNFLYNNKHWLYIVKDWA
jgi:hypothetical protein